MEGHVKERSIEVKVGLLILGALGLFAAFVLVMGQVSFQPKLTILRRFRQPRRARRGLARCASPA